MINTKTLIRQCLLALALAGSALGAVAGPINFHVDLDTTSLSGATGMIDLYFSKVGLAGPVTARVSNITGATGVISTLGDVSIDAAGRIVIASGPGFENFGDIAAMFGDKFGFDVAFSGDFMNETGSDGSTLYVSLLDSDFQPLAGDIFGVARFDVVPGIGIVSNGMAPIAAITAVPEPSDALLMMTGLGLVGFMVRRRKAPAAR
jgi:hypothetical protein